MTIDKTDEYGDIIGLPHHVSANRPRMSIGDRAAQFSAFAALKGYDDEIDEVARYTDEKIEPDSDRIDDLNRKLSLLAAQIKQRPVVKITYFRPDGKKSGGEYLTAQGNLVKIDIYDRKLAFADGLVVRFDNVFALELV